jgi:hypothetical protein
LGINNFLDGACFSISLRNSLVSFTISGLHSSIHCEVSYLDTGLKHNSISEEFGVGSVDVLTLNFSVLNFILKCIWKIKGSELEENNFMPGLGQYLSLQVCLHFVLDGSSLGEEIIGGVQGGSVRNNIKDNSVQDRSLIVSVVSVNVINVFHIHFVLK